MTASTKRPDGRKADELRPVKFTLDYVDYAEGSVLVELGGTRVLCNVSVEPGVPEWMDGRGGGWLTAEYGMLPRSTHTRRPRDTRGPDARSQEIRRLIGRSLRAAVDLSKVGSRTLTVDCDVLQADGGTRTAAVTGGYVAVALAMRRLAADGLVDSVAVRSAVAAVSIGVVGDEVLLDLCYAEDSRAEVDLNVVMTGDGRLIELQGTAEGAPFARGTLDKMLGWADRGVRTLIECQHEALS